MRGQVRLTAMWSAFALLISCYALGTAAEQPPLQTQSMRVEVAKQLLDGSKLPDIGEVCKAITAIVSSKDASCEKTLLAFFSSREVVEQLERNKHGKTNIAPSWGSGPFNQIDEEYKGRWKPYIKYPYVESDLLSALQAIIVADEEFGETFILKSLEASPTFGALLDREGDGAKRRGLSYARQRNSTRVAALGAAHSPSSAVLTLLRSQVLDVDALHWAAARRTVPALLASDGEMKAKELFWEVLLSDHKKDKNLGTISYLQDLRHLPGAFELLCDSYVQWGRSDGYYSQFILNMLLKPESQGPGEGEGRALPSYAAVRAQDVPRFLAASDKLLGITDANNKLTPEERKELEEVRAVLRSQAKDVK